MRTANEMLTRNQKRILSEAAARPSDGVLDVVSTASDKDPLVDLMSASKTVDIHVAASLLTQRSDESPPGRKGSSEGTSAQQGKAGLWTDEEIRELRRLVGIHTGLRGISWIAVEKAWINLDLDVRTKASLSSKWRDININAPTQVIRDNQKTSQESTKKASTVKKQVCSTSSVTTDAARTIQAPNDNSSTRKEKEKEKAEGQSDGTAVALTDRTAMKVIQMTFRKFLKTSEIIGCKPNSRKTPRRVSGRMIKPIIDEVDRLIGNELNLKSGSRTSWDKLSILVFAGAMTVSEMGNQRTNDKIKRSKDWFRNSYREVEVLCQTIGKSTAELNRQKHHNKEKLTAKQAINIRMLKKKYNVETYVELTSLVERLKIRLRLLRSRIALRKADEQRARTRQMPTKMVLRDNTGNKDKENKSTNETPDVCEIRRYWKGIVGVKKSFDPTNADLVAWEQSLTRLPKRDNLKDRLNKELWDEVVRKAKPWKAHGPDGIQSYWWKAFKTAGAALYQLARFHLTSGTKLPTNWITDGRIVLIHKAGPRRDPANYRPIACLNTCYKLLTSFITTYLNQYVKERSVLPEEQVALRGGVWGCTHALILDQSLIADAQDQRPRPISVAWIDYAKAFDSVPHSYINWLINALQVPKQLAKLIKSLLRNWKVRYEVKDPRGKTHRSNHLKIASGVLQGDSFSPLLFCIAMAPISHAINKMNCGYETASGKLKKMQLTLSHLFYMDDLKLYGSSSDKLTKLIKKVQSISTAINMKMNTKKCAVANFDPKQKRREEVGVKDSNPTAGNLGFPILESGTLYKYLGMEQLLGVEDSDAWDRVEEKCCKTATHIWSSDLTFRQKVNSFNTTIIPAVSYIAGNTIKGKGKYSSVLERGEKLDKKIRSMLVNLKARYKASCVARLYLATELGGIGLKSVEDSLKESTIYSWAYLCTRAEMRNSLNLFVGMGKRSKRSVISDARSVLEAYGITADLGPTRSIVNINGVEYTEARPLARHVVGLMRDSNNIRRHDEWGAKVMAGRVLSSTFTDPRASFAWLREGKLSSVAVRNVIAAQEGCLLTKTHPGCTTTNLLCRACDTANETIEHVTTSCSKWLPTLFVDRHDSVARSLHYRICDKYSLAPPHYSQRVESVMENDRVKLYWNQPVMCKTVIKHNKPDIIIFDKGCNKATIIEVAVSWFTGIEKQIKIKTNRYCFDGNWEDIKTFPTTPGCNILRELEADGWTVTFLPVVIGACGEVVVGLSDQIADCLGITKQKAEDCVERMERSAALGTSRIIKNHLAKPMQKSHKKGTVVI